MQKPHCTPAAATNATFSPAPGAAEALPDLIDGGVGVRAARFRGADLILGRKESVDDLVRPGMLHGAVVLSPHARALVVSIDTRKARAHPGVVAVATADDVPGKRHYGLLRDDWPGFVAAGEEVSYVGDIVAAIAAVDEATAGEAAALVDVAYEPLPPILDPENAERIFSRTHIKRGDVDAALAASAHVVRGRWRTQRIEHLFLEPESAMTEPLEGGRLRLFSSGQGSSTTTVRWPHSSACPRKTCWSSSSRAAARLAERKICRFRRTRPAHVHGETAREAHTESRGVDPHSSKAASDEARVHGRLRR